MDSFCNARKDDLFVKESNRLTIEKCIHFSRIIANDLSVECSQLIGLEPFTRIRGSVFSGNFRRPCIYVRNRAGSRNERRHVSLPAIGARRYFPFYSLTQFRGRSESEAAQTEGEKGKRRGWKPRR